MMRKTNLPRSEHLEQVSLVQWLRWTYPEILFFAVPNGGLRDKKVAVRMKNEGALAGVPDLFFPEPHRHWHGLFIEMKRRDKARTETKAQKEFRQKAQSRGYRCEVCAGADEAKKVVKEYFDL